MVGDTFGKRACEPVYEEYNHQDPRANTFEKATFIDSSKGRRVLFRYVGRDEKIAGHFIIPVYNPEYSPKFYQYARSNEELVAPTEDVSEEMEHQVVFVPAGQSHQVYDLDGPKPKYPLAILNRNGFCAVPAYGKRFW